MGTKERTIRTAMSVAECADVFRDAAADARGLSAKVTDRTLQAAGNNESGFFTPTAGDDPFAAIDGNKPDFEVGVLIRKFYGGANGAGTTVHMYVWDRGDHREVALYSPHDLFGSSRSGKMIDKFTGTFRQADPGLKAR
jgi:hypothetical protein